ncbi:acyl-CoA dehydrogenase family protein [Actinoallomurus spadix]|uniref:Acyl-CoA dehydrogenase n=1 Tax=Actinoallomurus spadix TaxID=79912 RepID=A0ABN0XIP7_9ACTN|nr:acyl-CoA dehydrogenase family protein [Actinoallomurus spadix]MCO5987532.1 acyl-CoA dehydrogenase family protein [Actinoallomurus spadix]
MDFRDTPEEAAFRAELRSWLQENAPQRAVEGGRGDFEALRAWGGRLYDAGYVGITWPEEYGGRGLSPTYQAIYLEEASRADAPNHPGVIGLNMAGPTIIAWGTDEQKQRYLKPLLSGEEIWCQGFSEPGSGSDLAAGRTSAVLDGDHWVVNGQKVWSSYAHKADWCILVVRTDPDAPKHAGLSYLIVDMHAPGVTVRPLRQITGDPEFNEIFFDDVRVPRESILGRPGDGWKVAMTTLLHERGTLGFALSAELERMVNHLVDLVREEGPDGRRPADDPLIRDAVAREWIEMQSLRFTNYRALTTLLETGIPGPEGSGVKLAWSEANQRLTSLAQSVYGLHAQVTGEDAPWNGFWQYWQLRSRGNTIEAGTSEILRNIIAERVLGLPKGR